LARGGGSLEDLQAFNSESLARAIFKSNIPVVSAVGHETDFTISDFVADLRAPTPSAAAEMIVPVKADLISRCQELTGSLIKIIVSYIEYLRDKTSELDTRLVDPKKKVQDLRLRTDDLTFRIASALGRLVNKKHEGHRWLIKQLEYNSPISRVQNNKATLYQINNNIQLYMDKIVKEFRSNLNGLNGKISALNPQSVLDRGYSITQTIPENTVVTDTGMVNIGQDLNVLLAKGSLKCSVKGKNWHGEKNI
jgi:exodeoxyribonuclease VII large subunit